MKISYLHVIFREVAVCFRKHAVRFGCFDARLCCDRAIDCYHQSYVDDYNWYVKFFVDVEIVPTLYPTFLRLKLLIALICRFLNCGYNFRNCNLVANVISLHRQSR
jgi:hypothetical protein